MFWMNSMYLSRACRGERERNGGRKEREEGGNGGRKKREEGRMERGVEGREEWGGRE